MLLPEMGVGILVSVPKSSGTSVPIQCLVFGPAKTASDIVRAELVAYAGRAIEVHVGGREGSGWVGAGLADNERGILNGHDGSVAVDLEDGAFGVAVTVRGTVVGILGDNSFDTTVRTALGGPVVTVVVRTTFEVVGVAEDQGGIVNGHGGGITVDLEDGAFGVAIGV
jgi:hypothetical protein